MYRANVRPLLSAVARAVNGIAAVSGRVSVDEPVGGWTLADGPYVVVSHVSGPAPVLRGDGDTLTRTVSVQVAVTETVAGEDPTLVETIAAALDGVAVDGYVGVVEDAPRVPDPDTDVVRHAITVRYPLVR